VFSVEENADKAPWWNCLPVVLITLLLVGLPVLLVLLLGRRAQVFHPKVREWMNTNSWIISEIVVVSSSP
jgi:hypothetical protein